MKKVQVLLSAYNGEKFIREQLESLLLQKGVDVLILIRDDGSIDNTKEILREYEICPNVEIIYGCNVGVTQSFFELIQNSDASCDYFAFCDQDDIWLEDKLLLAANTLSKDTTVKPMLYTSAIEIVNTRLRHIKYKTAPAKGFSFYNSMIENVIQGNTQVFNRALREILMKVKDAKRLAMHDHFVYILATAFGEVIYEDVPTIQYRQHDENIVGTNKNLARFLFENLSTVFSGRIKRISYQLLFLYQSYGNELKNEFVTEVKSFLFPRSILGRLKYIVHKKTFCQSFIRGFVFWVLYILGFLKINPDICL